MARIWRAAAIGDTGHADAEGNYLAFDMGHGLHLPYQYLPNVEMVAVADPDEAGRLRGMRDAGAKRAYADFHEMLAKEKPDVVSICSRQAVRHEAMILAAVDAGCHVFVDKPFTTDLASADRIIAACERRGVKLAIAYQSRYIEPFITAQKMLARGEIGQLLSMYGRVKEDHRGGGEDVICCGVHITDVMRMFAGDPQWVFGSVTQDGRPIALADAYDPADRNGLVAGDASEAMYGFDNGVVGYLTSVRNQHVRGERWGITLVGTEATLAIRFSTTTARCRNSGFRAPTTCQRRAVISSSWTSRPNRCRRARHRSKRAIPPRAATDRPSGTCCRLPNRAASRWRAVATAAGASKWRWASTLRTSPASACRCHWPTAGIRWAKRN